MVKNLLYRVAVLFRNRSKLVGTCPHRPHLKKKFVIGCFLFCITTWVLAGVLNRDIFLSVQILCLLSWNHFVLFDKKRKAYKDLCKPQRWECMGTLFGTIGFSVMLLLMML